MYNIYVFRRVAQLGRALRSGRRGRGFESRHADVDIGKKKDRQGFCSVYFLKWKLWFA